MRCSGRRATVGQTTHESSTSSCASVDGDVEGRGGGEERGGGGEGLGHVICPVAIDFAARRSCCFCCFPLPVPLGLPATEAAPPPPPPPPPPLPPIPTSPFLLTNWFSLFPARAISCERDCTSRGNSREACVSARPFNAVNTAAASSLLHSTTWPLHRESFS